MNHRRYAIAAVLLATGLWSPSARSQDAPTGETKFFPPSTSITIGALQERSPGRIVKSGIAAHQEFTGEAFQPTHGTPSTQPAAQPDFFDAVLEGILNEFFNQLAALIFGVFDLGDLDGTLGGLLGDGMTDATSESGDPTDTGDGTTDADTTADTTADEVTEEDILSQLQREQPSP